MKKTAVTLTCTRCGKTYERKVSQVARRGSSVCSRSCWRVPAPDAAELRRVYKATDGQGVATRFGVSRDIAYRWLREADIPLKSLSQVKREGAARMTPEQRMAMVAASLPLLMGPKSHATLVKRAMGVERAAKVWPNELAVWKALTDAGYPCVPHKAVDKYNIDIAIPSRMVAIEVDGGLWHTRHSPRKLGQDQAKEAVLNAAGWTVYRVRCRTLRTRWTDINSLLATLGGSFVPKS